MLINRGRYEDREIISRRSIEEMEKIRVETPGGYFRGEGYGFGLRITEDFFGRKLVGHGGSVLVYTAYIGYIESERLGVVVLANASGYSPSFIGLYALALALGRDPERELPFVRYERILEKLEGDYETFRSTMRVRIERRDSLLYMVSRGRYITWDPPLIPERFEDREYIFYTPSLGARIPVIFSERNGVIEMIYERYKFVKKR